MFVTTEGDQYLLKKIRQKVHPGCIVCGRAHECGLGLDFSLRDDGSVEAHFQCSETHQGYEGIMHGGIISALLDGAMTNCLFAQGIIAVTGEMVVRFRHPVELTLPLSIQGQIQRSQPPLYVATAEVIQNGQVKARAEGKFMQQPETGI